MGSYKALVGPSAPKASEITPEAFFSNRRRLSAALAYSPGLALGLGVSEASAVAGLAVPRPLSAKPSSWTLMDKATEEHHFLSYNNFYEFGTDKSDPAEKAPSRLIVEPWTLRVEGLVARPQTFGLQDLLRLAAVEERVYRLRCVEGWSMVVPWLGLPLASLIKRVQPLGSAKYLQFLSLADEKQMPGLRSDVLQWPYREGLRMDEATHDLTLLAVGAYGKTLASQNGAPIRLVVPWKYGFKSAKSIVSIKFVERQPQISWQKAAAHEYGFYSNVNPDVSHRRWSQATERRIGEGGLFASRRPTLMFNGYAEQVAFLYTGMDLRRYY
ncbi:MAG: protein-methionine-sulfoxide reductase catalytic subunit MsrP [Bordetella sp.]|jgi:sulfoxide reductase catalytic subunit YedY